MFSAQQILTPVSGTRPGGSDLAFSPELDAIAHARKFDDPSLDQGEWITDLKEADWGFVVDRCAALLETRSKDLRLAVWLAEAAAYKYNLPGLAESWRVLAGLCERYWDDGLFPEADGDQEQRIGNLAWILGRTPALLRAIPVDGVQAADAAGCMEALKAFEQAADARLGADSPSFTPAREALQALLHAIPSPAAHAAPAPVIHTGAWDQPVAAPQPGAIASRAQAVTLLRTVAQFFRKTEPHSPVSYFADKAADAADLDLHTWLRSVIKDPASMEHVEELLGVKGRPQA
jgi:type VI secretion system protein ImpA